MKSADNLSYSSDFSNEIVMSGEAVEKTANVSISSEVDVNNTKLVTGSVFIDREIPNIAAVSMQPQDNHWTAAFGVCNCSTGRNCFHAVALARRWASILKSRNAPRIEKSATKVREPKQGELLTIETAPIWQKSDIKRAPSVSHKPRDVSTDVMPVAAIPVPKQRRVAAMAPADVATPTLIERDSGREKLQERVQPHVFEANRVYPRPTPSFIIGLDPENQLQCLLRVAHKSPERTSLFCNASDIEAFCKMEAPPGDTILDRIHNGIRENGIRVLSDSNDADLLFDIVGTGRARWLTQDNKVSSSWLEEGEIRKFGFSWVMSDDGSQDFKITCGEHYNKLFSVGDDIVYVDLKTCKIGLVESRAKLSDINVVKSLCPLQAQEASQAISKIKALASEVPLPLDPTRLTTFSEMRPILTVTNPSHTDKMFAIPEFKLEFGYGDFRFSDVHGENDSVYRKVNDSYVRIVRDTEAERSAEQVVQSSCVGRAYMDFELDAVKLREQGWTINRIGFAEHRFVEVSSWEAEFQEERVGNGIPWFSFGITASIDGVDVEMSHVLTTAMEQLKHPGRKTIYVRLHDGRILPMQSEQVRPLISALTMMTEGKDGESSRRLDLAAELAAASKAIGARMRSGGSILRLAMAFASGEFPKVQTPKGFLGELRHYQEEGASWLALLSEFGLGGLLAFDMGLGKTPTTLFHIMAEKAAGRLDDQVLVVAPVSVRSVWKSEVKKFAPSLNLYVWENDGKGSLTPIPAGTNIVVTTYAMLERHASRMALRRWSLVILDEAQNIKNPSSKASLAASRLIARQRIALSGTPVENHLSDLWSIFRFLEPSLLGSREVFRRTFSNPIENASDERAGRMLSRLVKPFIMRRTKEEVALDLPEKIDNVERVQLTPKQAQIYEAVRASMEASVQATLRIQGLNRGRMVIMTALLRLRQACLDPRLVPMSDVEGVESAKLQRLVEILLEAKAEGRKVIVFSQFAQMLEYIAEALDEVGLTYMMLTGKTKNRGDMVEEFQAGGSDVFLISLKAGGSGITLTKAEMVIHFDPWWNPAVESQATDRAHRIGQTQTVFVHRLIAIGTIEEGIMQLQEKKKAVADVIFSEDHKALSLLSESEIRALFAISPTQSY